MQMPSKEFGAVSLALFCIIAIGFCARYRRLQSIEEDIDFLESYRVKFIKWCEANFNLESNYNDLIALSSQAQDKVGEWGRVVYRAPYQSIVVNDLPVILNLIPMIRQAVSIGLRRSHTIEAHTAMVDECLLRAIGDLRLRRGEQRKFIFNPHSPDDAII